MGFVLVSEDSAIIANKISEIAKEKNINKVIFVYDNKEINRIESGLLNNNYLYVKYTDTILEDYLDMEDVIQVVPKIDNRLNVFKKNKHLIVDLTDSSKYSIQYIIDNSDLDEREALDLYSKCGNNLTSCIRVLSQYRFSEINYSEFKNWIFCFTEENIFNLCDAIIKKDFEVAKYELDIYKKKDASYMSIMSVLQNLAKQLVLIKSGDPLNVINNYYVKQKLMKLKDYRNIEELKNIILLCQEVESSVKKGTIDNSIVAEYVYINCMR